MLLIVNLLIKKKSISRVDPQYRQIPWVIRIFSTHRKSEKYFPYGSFFLCTKTFGHNTFCIALHVIKIDNFNNVNYKITNKNN